MIIIIVTAVETSNLTLHNRIYNDIKNDFARKSQGILKSGDSSTGQQAVHQQKDDEVKRILNKVEYFAKIKNGTRNYKHGSSSRSSENDVDGCKRT
jgi:hypothetical protein